MKISTKYDIGQEVFVIENKQIRNVRIDYIEIHSAFTAYHYSSIDNIVSYTTFGVKAESEIFDIKEDAVERLNTQGGKNE